MSAPPEGLLPVDKPAGPTSHDVVARIRKITGRRRIGHSGTLDPAATGLLLVAIGRATRLIRFLPQEPKCYSGRFRLGLTTDTDDLEGQVLERADAPLPGPDDVITAAAALLGVQRQVPPAFSARKRHGQRLYALARRGMPVEAPPVRVEVTRFDVAPGGTDADWCFEAAVSSGTYIRALVRDLGRQLGCGGTLTELRREAIGPLTVAQAVPLEGLTPEQVVGGLWSLERMPLVLPSLRLEDEGLAREFAAGRSSAVAAPGNAGMLRIVGPDGRLLGVGEARDDRLQPRVVLRPDP